MIKRLAMVAILLAIGSSSLMFCSRSSLAQTSEEIEELMKELNRRVFSFPTPESFIILTPDLVVDAAGLKGDPVFKPSGKFQQIHVPFQVLVRNQGYAIATPFKVAVEYTAMGQPLIVPFNVPGSGPVYPSTSNNLLPGKLSVFDGELIFPTSIRD